MSACMGAIHAIQVGPLPLRHYASPDVTHVINETRPSPSLVPTPLPDFISQPLPDFISQPLPDFISQPLPDFISQPWRKIGRRPGTNTTSRTGNGGLDSYVMWTRFDHRLITRTGIGNGIFTHHHPCNASGFVTHAHKEQLYRALHYSSDSACTKICLCIYNLFTIS